MEVTSNAMPWGCWSREEFNHRSNTRTCQLGGCFQKKWYPEIIHFNRVFHYKPSFLGYHYFWKHPGGGWTNPSEKYESNWIISPRFGVKIQKLNIWNLVNNINPSNRDEHPKNGTSLWKPMVMVHLGYQAVCDVRVQCFELICGSNLENVGRPQLEASDTHTHTPKKQQSQITFLENIDLP